MILYNIWKKVFLSNDLIAKLTKKKLFKYLILKTYNNNIKISSLFNNTIIKVYNGKRFLPIKINSLKFGFKLKHFVKIYNSGNKK